MKDISKLEKRERTWRFLKGLIFVPKCVGCGEVLSPDRLDDGENIFCDRCRSSWEREKLKICPLCQRSYAECTCPTEILAQAGCGVLVTLSSYKSGETGIVQKAVFRIKNEYDRELTDFLAKEMCYRIFSMVYELGAENIVVTYAPRTNKARRQKGHDQSEKLARRVAVHLGAEYARLIKRQGASFGSKKQKTLNKSQRLLNAHEAFAPTDEIDKVKGKCVILIDDIVTTGSSLGACTEILRGADALSVMCVTVARTVQQKGKSPNKR